MLENASINVEDFEINTSIPLFPQNGAESNRFGRFGARLPRLSRSNGSNQVNQMQHSTISIHRPTLDTPQSTAILPTLQFFFPFPFFPAVFLPPSLPLVSSPPLTTPSPSDVVPFLTVRLRASPLFFKCSGIHSSS